MTSESSAEASEAQAALIAHRRRMGMIPTSEMPPTREVEDDCGCGPSGAKVPEHYSYKPRGTKAGLHSDLKVKHG